MILFVQTVASRYDGTLPVTTGNVDVMTVINRTTLLVYTMADRTVSMLLEAII